MGGNPYKSPGGRLRIASVHPVRLRSLSILGYTLPVAILAYNSISALTPRSTLAAVPHSIDNTSCSFSILFKYAVVKRTVFDVSISQDLHSITVTEKSIIYDRRLR